MKKSVVVLLALLVLAACAPTLTPEQQAFKALCEKNAGEWMKMAPMKEGKFTAKEACRGCMADMMTMTCTMDEYQAWLSERQSSEGMKELPQNMGGMK
jgi:cytochrome c5